MLHLPDWLNWAHEVGNLYPYFTGAMFLIDFAMEAFAVFLAWLSLFCYFTFSGYFAKMIGAEGTTSHFNGANTADYLVCLLVPLGLYRLIYAIFVSTSVKILPLPLEFSKWDRIKKAFLLARTFTFVIVGWIAVLLVLEFLFLAGGIFLVHLSMHLSGNANEHFPLKSDNFFKVAEFFDFMALAGILCFLLSNCGHVYSKMSAWKRPTK